MGVQITFKDTYEVTLDEIMTVLPNSRATKKATELREALKAICSGEYCMNGDGGVLREMMTREEMMRIARHALAD